MMMDYHYYFTCCISYQKKEKTIPLTIAILRNRDKQTKLKKNWNIVIILTVSITTFILTVFDYNSIMIYGSYAFSRNGRPTMLPKNHSIKLRESHFKQSLSTGDVININAMYGCN